MDERYLCLFSLKDKVSQDGCPVIIEAGALYNDTLKNDTVAQLKFINKSEKTVAEVSIRIELMDEIGTLIGNVITFKYEDIMAKSGDTFGPRIAIPIGKCNAKGFNVIVTEVQFADNTIWKCANIGGLAVASLEENQKESIDVCVAEGNRKKKAIIVFMVIAGIIIIIAGIFGLGRITAMKKQTALKESLIGKSFVQDGGWFSRFGYRFDSGSECHKIHAERPFDNWEDYERLHYDVVFSGSYVWIEIEGNKVRLMIRFDSDDQPISLEGYNQKYFLQGK